MTKLTIIKDFKGDWTLLIQEIKHRQLQAFATIPLTKEQAKEISQRLQLTPKTDNS